MTQCQIVLEVKMFSSRLFSYWGTLYNTYYYFQCTLFYCATFSNFRLTWAPTFRNGRGNRFPVKNPCCQRLCLNIVTIAMLATKTFEPLRWLDRAFIIKCVWLQNLLKNF